MNTPRSIEAHDYYTAAKTAYEKQDWESVVVTMQQIAALEPEMADPYYYIGEAYRFMGENSKAFDAYRQAIEIDPNFGPAYLGRARVLPPLNPKVNIKPDLDKAIEYSPDFAEAYLERARYYAGKNRPDDALADLETARSLAPGSPLVHLELAKTYLALEMNEEALAAAQKANELDLTMLESYLVLGQAYEANDQLGDALGALQTYIVYEPDDTEALSLLGGAYYATGDYQAAIETLDHALELSRRLGKAYLYRGLSYVALEDGENAENDLKSALLYFPNSFKASMGLAQADVLQEHYGDCYLQVEHSRPMADGDEDWALIYYWRATCHEGRNDLKSATADWEALLALPLNASTSQMRAEARQHLYAIRTPAPTPTATRTRTPTPTP